MAQLFADAARAYLSAGITAGDTAISISSGGSLFPVANGTNWFKAVLQDANGIEIVYVTAHTSGATSFTVTRGQEGTTARSFAAGSVFGIRVTSADMAGFAGKLSDAPSDGKTYGRKDAAWAEVVSGGGAIAGPRNWYVSQHTASSSFVVPAGVSVIRPYAFGAGAAGTATNSGGGGGCAYGDIAVTPGATVTLSIAAGVAKVTYGGVDLLIANPASGVTGGTASKHASVANGGAYSGGAGAADAGGASSGSPLGAGVAGHSGGGGSGWGGNGSGFSGGGAGGASTDSRYGADGLPFPSSDPLLRDLTGYGGVSAVLGGSGQPGGGGASGQGPSGTGVTGGRGGFGAGGGAGIAAAAQGMGGDGGFGGGGGKATGSTSFGGKGGFGGGGGKGTNAGGADGPAVIRIYY